ncbi:sugar phosphate isomerase/epimerase [Chloroflexi bacterium TSY]|nr:sugar phosphate isomerase/epimerase [Chloroflexi bacterium TSY]
MFTISAFGDEIAVDLQEQLDVMNQLNIRNLELRAAWDINIVNMEKDAVAKAKELCDAASITVSGIGSPIGKSPLADPAQKELTNLDRIFQNSEKLGTRNIRIFSFYPPEPDDEELIEDESEYIDGFIDDAAERLNGLTEQAQRHGFILLLENEKGIVGDTVARCHKLIGAIKNPYLRFAWDPANFVQVGEAQVTTDGWPLLGEYVGYVHIKDALLDGGVVKAAGEGDGQVGELLDALRDSGYEGFLALEPHLAIAGHSSGFSGSDGMAYAVKALRDLMEKHECEEVL